MSKAGERLIEAATELRDALSQFIASQTNEIEEMQRKAWLDSDGSELLKRALGPCEACGGEVIVSNEGSHLPWMRTCISCKESEPTTL